jgi:hypothetical protein
VTGFVSIDTAEMRAKAMRAMDRDEASDRTPLYDEVIELSREVDRLRGLIKSAETCGSGAGCPWCSSMVEGQTERHGDNCTAFTPDGTVR